MKPATVNVLAELEKYGIPFIAESENTVRVRCPFHDDRNPSCSVWSDSGKFLCRAASCGKTGHIIGLLAQSVGHAPQTVLLDLSQRYDLNGDDAKTIDIALVEKFHANIEQAGPLLKALYDRTITNEDIRKYRLGFDGNRITIPIFNGRGEVVNIRRYLPGAPAKMKMRNERGFSRPRLYPFSQLEFEKIVLTGGEIKAIAGARVLNPQGIGCITVAGGEGTWNEQFGALFNDKAVILCFDIDKGGRVAAQKIGAALVNHAATIKDLVLPLDPASYPKGDLNDYLAVEEDSVFVGLVMNAPKWVPLLKYGERINETEEPQEVELSQAYEAQFTKKRVSFKATIAAMHQSPFTVPSKVSVNCSRDQPFCGHCPVKHEKLDEVYTIPAEHPALLRMVGSTEAHQLEAIKNALGIPAVCRMCQSVPCSFYNIEDVKLSPELDLSSRATERTMQPAIIIGRQLELNDSYEMVGRMYPHPQNQQATIIVSEAIPSQDALSTFDASSLQDLAVFQPSEWSVQGIQQKLDALYSDLTANVTRVFKRNEMHLLMDLIYHSPLRVQFDGRTIKGWAECLIIGDSSQGKSEVFDRLREYYQLGVKVDCASTSAAGLHGGLQQIGGKWYVTWGVIPMHDRRLVCLEEVKRASVELLARLTDMRSSGKAEIYKIEKRSTHARTRLIAMSNPRNDLPMRSHNYGVEAVKELMGSLEDVRRFDAVMAVTAGDIEAKELNLLTSHRPKVENTHTSDLCRKLILWAWTRLDAQVVFDDDAEAEVLQVAIRMSDKYSDNIPIVDRGSQRLKIARLSAALAARTFSHGDSGHGTIRIRLCHVQYIEQFLYSLYDSPALGYKAYSDSQQQQNEISDASEVEIRILALRASKDFVNLITDAGAVDISDLMDWGGLGRDEAQDLLSFLVRHHALLRRGKFYRKSPAFMKLLKGLEDKELPEHLKKPEY